MPKLTGLARLAGLAARVAGSIRALAGQIGPRLVVVNLVVLLVNKVLQTPGLAFLPSCIPGFCRLHFSQNRLN